MLFIRWQRLFLIAIFIVLMGGLFCSNHEEPLVLVSELDSTIVIDLPYSTRNNFTGEVLYDTALCFLRKSVAERLVRVQHHLQNEHGLGLKVWDGYRPHAVQWKMWELVQDSRYVADPEKGSRHNRGAAIDVTLVDSTGKELPMPTGFDDFTEQARSDYSDLPEKVIRNREILKDAMRNEGFTTISSEWWHFDAPNWKSYPMLDIPLTEVNKRR